MCVGLAIDQDARIGDGHLEEVMEQELSPLARCRNDIEWDCMCEVLYEAPRDPVGGRLERAACQCIIQIEPVLKMAGEHLNHIS
jgi:hypothetical protein